MKEITKHIPNFITTINVFCGCIGIVFAFQYDWDMVMLMMFIALVADFLDGFVARLLHVSSAIGEQLDSLADAVTFGVLPGVVMYHQMTLSACGGQCTGLLHPDYYPYAAFLIPVLSIVRLAKFNVDTEQTTNFKGLPTPINAAFFVSIPFVLMEYEVHPKVLLLAVLLMSFALVSDVKLLALKFKTFGLKENWAKYLIVVVGIISLVLFEKAMFIVITPAYFLISILYYLLKKED